MDKQQLIQFFLAELKRDLESLNQAALATYQGAIHSDSKAEDRYDTRGLEASYLAGAQAKRVLELETLIKTFEFIDIKNFGPSDKITATALVGIQSEEKISFFLLMPKGGGLSLKYEGKTIQILTPQSPLGEVILGKKLHDEFEVLIQNKFKDFVIVYVA